MERGIDIGFRGSDAEGGEYTMGGRQAMPLRDCNRSARRFVVLETDALREPDSRCPIPIITPVFEPVPPILPMVAPHCQACRGDVPGCAMRPA